ncbi:MAG TPA: 4-hydroxybutyrate CoA-transferase [Bdellovibrionales bacterium]|nr:4-hydroxybutyrate CoA-transferase [Bdellovibrionales bacterium]
MKSTSLTDAISLIPNGSRIFVHGAAATPNALLRELVLQANQKSDLTMIHLHTEGPAEYAQPQYSNTFRVINLFVGSNVRKQMDYKHIDYLPCFLSEIPGLFLSEQCPLDVALLHVSPPDRFGYCSLGVSADVAVAAASRSEILIAQVNSKMPRLHGDGLIHKSQFHAMVEMDEELPQLKSPVPSKSVQKIGRFVAELIEDGSTLQMGIGSIPDAVTRELTQHKDLGLHSEMWSDGALRLIQNGVINNSLKKIHPGKSVSTFLLGSKELYDFVDDNPSVLNLAVDYVNNPINIARNPKVVAINSAVEVDLTGQVCADSVGHKIISGVGGQMDFMRGAALSKGGKPIIAMESLSRNGVSKIVAQLKPGAGVVTTRSHVHFVVTEFGVAELYGKTLGERAKALIEVAHPDHQEQLEKDFWHSHC